jgi:hypothetical protein
MHSGIAAYGASAAAASASVARSLITSGHGGLREKLHVLALEAFSEGKLRLVFFLLVLMC